MKTLSKKGYVTARKLRSLFRYLMNHKIPVKIIGDYDNSLDMRNIRVCEGVVTEYNITPVGIDAHSVYEYIIKWKMDSVKASINVGYTNKMKPIGADKNTLFEESLPSDTRTSGFGRFIWNNSGPDCSLIFKLNNKKGSV